MKSALALFILAGIARATTPILFFTDLTSAPITGGETSGGFAGAYVTIYGNFFGVSQGSSTITWNGLDCLRVVPSVGNYSGWGTAHLWYQKIIVQLGSSCTAGTGNFVVTTSGGTSNGLSFTTRAIGSNHIYFVSTTGNDSNSGTFASPLRTLTACAWNGRAMIAGDICYGEDGLTQTSIDAIGVLTLGQNTGTPTLPIAIGGYPGAVVTIGTNSVDKGIDNCNGFGGCPGSPQYWTIFNMTGISNALSIVTYNDHTRIIGNIAKRASGSGVQVGVMMSAGGSFTTLYGNDVFETAGDNNNKQAHGIYLGADGHDFEVGWNRSHDIFGGRALQIHNDTDTSFNVSIHDNRFYNTVNVDGVVLNVNPDAGAVSFWNNVVYHAAQSGPSGGDAACLYMNSATATPTTRVEVYNNSFYDCGWTGGPIFGLISATIPFNLRNNIFYAVGGVPYFSTGFATASFAAGNTNVYFGNGNGPAQTTGNINSDPLFIDRTTGDFHLQSGSPARDSGITIGGVTNDLDGVPRPQGSAYDIGAFEFLQATPLGSFLGSNSKIAGASVMK